MLSFSITKSSPLVLVILDGWGFSPSPIGNAILQANTPVIDDIKAKYPFSLLQASSLAVGMAWGESGNSEVGHLSIGTGRIIEQYPVRINKAIKSGDFFSNPSLIGAFDHATNHGGNIHLAGLLTSGSVHAHFEHLLALIKLAEQKITGTSSFAYLHLFLDGKDSGLKEGMELFEKLGNEIIGKTNFRVATTIGRNFPMDRDSHWDFTQTAYNLIVRGEGQKVNDFKIKMSEYYAADFTDSTMPGMSAQGYSGMRNGESIIFFNFREDSMRQIIRAFIGDSDFTYFPLAELQDIYVATMTPYLPNARTHSCFALPEIKNTLAEILEQNNRTQLHIAETDKYAHVTFFFNGLTDTKQSGEEHVFIKSDKNSPRLSTPEIAQRVLEEIDKEIYDFFVINFANADILAHEGDLEKAKMGIECVDQMLGLIKKKVVARNGIMIITADHANAESMTYKGSGSRETKHNNNPVPLFLLGDQLIDYKDEDEIAHEEKEIIGILADVTPTILEIFGIQKPVEVTGESLLEQLLN